MGCGEGGGSPAEGAGGPKGQPDAGGQPAARECAEPPSAYEVSSMTLDESFVPELSFSSWGGELFTRIPVAVGEDGTTYVGFSRRAGETLDALVVVPGEDTPRVEVSGAAVGGLAATSDGFALLLFDPSRGSGGRWAAVARYNATGDELFREDLFRSTELESEGTKGEPDTSRLAYLPEEDALVAYFGHTQR